MELFIDPSAPETFLIRLVASYLKLEERGSIRIVALSDSALTAVKKGNLKMELPSLVTSNGEVITETFGITHHLLSLQKMWGEFFLGSTAAEREEVVNIKVHLKGAKQLRKYLQKHLEDKTFFVSNHLTFADLFMFVQLYDNVLDMKDEQKLQYNNIFRWYKHIQNLPEIRSFLLSENRMLVGDPEQKLTFLEVKKKKK